MQLDYFVIGVDADHDAYFSWAADESLSAHAIRRPPILFAHWPEGIGHYTTPIPLERFVSRSRASKAEKQRLLDANLISRTEAEEKLSWAINRARLRDVNTTITTNSDIKIDADCNHESSDAVCNSQRKDGISEGACHDIDGEVNVSGCELEGETESDDDGQADVHSDVSPCGLTSDDKKRSNDNLKMACPCCGKIKKIHKSVGQAALALAVAAQRDFEKQFKKVGIELRASGRFLRSCGSCTETAKLALKAARQQYPLYDEFNRNSSKMAGAAVLPVRPILCRGSTLVSTCFALCVD